MQTVPRGGSGVRLFWGLMLGLPAIFALAGLGMMAAGFTQAPRDDANAQLFRSDPSCVADLRPAAAGGACTVETATVVTIDPAITGNNPVVSGAAGNAPSATLTLGDGSTVNVTLAGNAGATFAHAIYPGTKARVQLFQGSVVRVAQGGVSAETSAAPDARASSDARLPWAGVFVTVVGVIGFLFARRLKRRAGAAY